MPTTILHGETIEQARHRRFFEEAMIDAAIFAKLQTAYHVTVKTSRGLETLNVTSFTACDAIVQAIDIMFDGEQPMPADGMAITAYPLMKDVA